MSVPLIYENHDAVKHVGSMKREENDTDIKIEFTPISGVWIRSGAFNSMKNKIVNNIGAAVTWDNTGKITVHIDACDPDRRRKVSEIRKLVTWTYGVLLEANGFREDDLIQVAPGIWMLESDSAMARLDKAGQEKLEQALREIFTERPLKLFISTPVQTEEMKERFSKVWEEGKNLEKR